VRSLSDSIGFGETFVQGCCIHLLTLMSSEVTGEETGEKHLSLSAKGYLFIILFVCLFSVVLNRDFQTPRHLVLIKKKTRNVRIHELSIYVKQK